MKRAILILAGALAACSVQPAKEATAPSPIVAITLPVETAALPETPAGTLVTQNCTACHSAEMIQQQPPLDAAKWAATVKKMREAYHAPFPADSDTALTKALVDLQGG